MGDSRKRHSGSSSKVQRMMAEDRLTRIVKMVALAFLLIVVGRAMWSVPATDSTASAGRIEITASALQHIADRHTPGGSMNDGKSIFNAGENIPALIKSAELLSPEPQARGNFQRVFDAGRSIGIDRATGKQTSTYSVITTDSGKLVTAFPGLP